MHVTNLLINFTSTINCFRQTTSIWTGNTVLALPFLLHLQGASSMQKHCPSPVITADILCHSLVIASGDDDITRGWGSWYLLTSRHLITMIIKLLEHSVACFVHRFCATNLPKCSTSVLHKNLVQYRNQVLAHHNKIVTKNLSMPSNCPAYRTCTYHTNFSCLCLRLQLLNAQSVNHITIKNRKKSCKLKISVWE